MYGLLRQGLPSVSGASAPRRWSLWAGVGRTVILLGITSLLTDISSEMVAAVLPLYLLYELQVSTLQLGIVDGIYQGCSGLVRLGAGFAADRWSRHKDVAAGGYALSAISRVGLAAAGGALGGIAAAVLVDRVGKGIRTAPRDALISLSVPKETLGTAFGVHRLLDTTGALLGPLVAFGLLALTPRAFDIVFVPSFMIALIGVGVIVLLVDNRTGPSDSRATGRVSLRDCLHLLRLPRFRALVLAAALLTVCTASDAFIYVGLQRRGSLAISLFPLLYVATSAFYLMLALPAGHVADRLGRHGVFLVGQTLFVGIYAVLLAPSAGWLSVLALPLLGAYYACTDGVLMAAASAELEEHVRTSGLALLTTVTSLASLVSSVMIGALWSFGGMEAAFETVAVGFVAALLFGWWSLHRVAHA